MSVSALLTELVRRADRDAIFRAEREAARADAADNGALAEEREWETSLGDGLA
jgi:hypothetical protein